MASKAWLEAERKRREKKQKRVLNSLQSTVMKLTKAVEAQASEINRNRKKIARMQERLDNGPR